MLFPATILTTAYLPPVEYLFAIAQSGRIFIEGHEQYQKQSYRNRCVIYSASGPETLSIPVVKSAHRIAVRDVRIDYSEHWIQKHERAMTAAYNSSPFFEYYKDEIFEIIGRKETFLFDLNCLLTEKMLELTGIKADIDFTDSYSDSYPEGDMRVRIQPKYRGASLLEEYHRNKPYFQVFPSGKSFLPNLSSIDLLSAEGPNAISFLI